MQLTEQEMQLKTLLTLELAKLLQRSEQIGVPRPVALSLMSAIAMSTLATECGAEKAYRVAANLSSRLQAMSMLETLTPETTRQCPSDTSKPVTCLKTSQPQTAS